VKNSSRKFRHLVTVESQVDVIDSNGDHSREWEYVTTIWAEIKPLSGRELLLAQQFQSQVSTNIETRYRSDIDATCRLKHNGTTYNALAVIRDPQSGLEWMTLPCSSGTNDG
jgi:SPP1 family predicted phage head-tail adaptor